MSLSDINTLKELAVSYQALVLAEVIADDGAALRISSADISNFAGHTFWGRILSQNLGALQELSAEGLDIMPSISFSVADADKAIFGWDRLHGIAGSRLNLVFAYYDWDSQFSSDSYRVFIGRCTGGGVDDLTFTFGATSLLNLSTKREPSTPIQPTCPWNHPDTLAQKALANVPGSLFYRCGDSNPAHTSCDRTKANCVANGMYSLGRFGGFQWDPPLGIRTEKEYITGNKVQVQSNPNHAKYNDFIPIVYGTAWLECTLNSIIPDGNSTRGEAFVCDGEIFNLAEVLCDDEILPCALDLAGNVRPVQDLLFCYRVFGNGSRNGSVNTDKGFDGLGDPAGSIVRIEYLIPRRTDNPRVQALVQGRKVRVYSSPSFYDIDYSENPVWILADLLNRSGWSYDDMNLDQFYAEAQWCDELIPYTDGYGNLTTRPRYRVSLVIRERKTLAELVQGLRRSCNAVMNWGGTSGLLEIYIKKTLVDQQPSGPDGSGTTAFDSMHADGTPGGGFPAYGFYEYNTISLKRLQPNPSIANTVSIPFVNAQNNYSLDSLKVVDLDGINYDGQENNSNIVVLGPNSQSQARAIGDVHLAEQRKGNPRLDAKGTETWELETTSKGVKLKIGQLITIQNAKYAL